MAGLNTFDNRSVERISSTVRSYEKEVIRTKDQPRRRRSTANGGAQIVYPVKIKSGSNGVYEAVKINADTGEEGETITIFASRATGYDLTDNKSAVGLEVKLTTMG